ncbi:ecto-ADP-ribosyltransferase 4 [Theropithecus gelada]|uniref:ecto-ADP-ribosyltransferase 4 n=1 Tax=Theropithecus gelada TaxID=9565 RepID=UPI000DC17818|nr:ecto-ADP-ribosyltransferase 4 [Theropithecus gelada]
MKMQGQRRSTCDTSKWGPLINRCKKILLPTTAAPTVIRIWLLGGLLPFLLLLSGLQRPTDGSEVAMKIDFDFAPGSFDDQYQGCSKEVMEKLTQGDYFTKDIEAQKNYFGMWQKAHLTWLNQGKVLPQNMTTTHAVAILFYTLNSNVRSNFTRAVAYVARAPQQYERSFQFKYLHYYLTTAVQLLRKDSVMKNGTPLCYKVHYRTKDVHFSAYTGATIRFGQFLSTSLLKEEAQEFGNQTLFTIFTCLGAPVQYFSLKKEVLIPPYELFKVINMSSHPRGNWLQLRSTGNLSTYNCQLLKASSKKCIPDPVTIASLSFLASVIIFSKSLILGL